jgi:uncharacterized protein (TIGR02270 family)
VALNAPRGAAHAVVLQQHAEEAAALRHVRAVLLRSPHVQLHRLRRLDDRIAAHLDGLQESGASGLAVLHAALEAPSAGVVFALAVLALQQKDASALSQIASLAMTLPEARQGWLSALGWVSAHDLQGTVRSLLGSKVAMHRAWGLAAGAMHRVDPGPVLAQALQDPEQVVQAQAWRVAGQMGRVGLIEAGRYLVKQPPKAEDASVRQWAGWALTLWGAGADEAVRRALLGAMADGDGALPAEGAQRLAVLAAPLEWGRDQVRALSTRVEASRAHKRRMLRMVAWVGDVQVMPWLIGLMADDAWARLAGETFSLITGADLALLDLERQPPEGGDGGPDDTPDDDNVAMDEDDSLPWPDQAKVQAWWQANAHRFQPGQRYFVGEPPTAAHGLHVLKTQGQRARIIAAEHLCLLRPGSKLFPVAAPAWRQARWLGEEEAALASSS